MPVPADSNLAYIASLGGGRVSLTFMSNQGSWIERLTIATGERITVVPPGVAGLFVSPSWSLDGTRYVVTARSQPHVADAEVYAGTVALPVRRLTCSDR